MLDDKTLRRNDEEYWKSGDENWYVRNLLGNQLEYAASHEADDGLPRLPGWPFKVHTLALTVGESVPPLLQSICLHKPQKVILILNREYSSQTGETRGKMLTRIIKSLRNIATIPESYRPNLTDGDISSKVITSDTPTQVFRALQSTLVSPIEDTPESWGHVIDITGAKKTMVVGAFLFAAHTGLPMSYVDFDANAYAKWWGRPYGHLCKIRHIANPYDAFGLRDWERVRQLYERYDFRGARELLGVAETGRGDSPSIREVMAGHIEEGAAGPSLFDKDDLAKLERLDKVIELYQAWDSGDFHRAWELSTESTEIDRLPSVIERLGPDWRSATADQSYVGAPEFYRDREQLKLYSWDELQRIQRLIELQHDYRSAFLRAAGLNEVILTARLVQLVGEKKQSTDLEEMMVRLEKETPNALKVFGQLLKQPGETIQLEKLYLGSGSVPVQEPMKHWWRGMGGAFDHGDGYKRFIELRNTLTHRYVWVEQSLAEDALRFVRANYEDFFRQNPHRNLITDHPCWARLVTAIPLDFLPPKLRT